MNQDKINEWKAARKSMRLSRDAAHLFELIQKGDISGLSAAITLLESSLTNDQQEAKALIRMCLPLAGKSLRIGITGVPGVGKSTFIEQFGNLLLSQGFKIAVLAIDPSSERTGGSILGDKTRMESLSQKEGVFIRPSASGNTLGGVARKTRESIMLCEAAGFDVVIIETVGVGQSETMVHSMVDFFLLLLLAGAGDELQGIKRGIMEMADGLAVTKSDGENNQLTKIAAGELKNAIHLFPPTKNGWIPEVHTCSSISQTNIDVVWEMIQRFERHTKLNGSFHSKRHRQDRNWMHDSLRELLMAGLQNDPNIQTMLPILEHDVEEGKVSAFEAAEKIYQTYLKNLK
jgi:LAO/AO transport system kinase